MSTPQIGPPFNITTPLLFPASAFNGMTLDLKRTPTFDTDIQKAVSGRETATSWQEFPIWKFELTWEFLNNDPNVQSSYSQDNTNYTDTERLLGFYIQCRGQFQPFYLRLADLTRKNSDSQVQGQLVGVGDGVTTNFQLVRSLGAAYEPIQNLDTEGPQAVYLNGAPQNAGWAMNATTGILSFASAPAAGVKISADFSWFYLCRFDADTMDIDNLMYLLDECQQLVLRTVIT